MHILSLPNLELRWLRHASKDLPTPVVVVGECDSAACYYDPINREITCADGNLVDGRRGLIVIGEKSIDNFSFGALLAHEWRHHYQRFNARLYYDEPKRSSEEASYKEKTIAYYTTSRCEYDALSFECAMAPNDGSLAQLEWVRQYEEKVLTRCATRSTMQFMATSLTSRQEEILRWVCEGKTEAEIGIILNISEYTVASHINNIRERLDINKNALLVRWAIRNQLVTA